MPHHITLYELLQDIIDCLPKAKREELSTKLETIRYSLPPIKQGWTEERKAKQSKAVSEYWQHRRVEQPFELVYRNGERVTIKGWEAAAKAAGVKEPTLRIKLSKGGGTKTQFYDNDLNEVVGMIKLPYEAKN